MHQIPIQCKLLFKRTKKKLIMEQEKRQLEVCNRSLTLARQHKASGNYVRAFAHYLVHKNILWELTKQDKMSQETANMSEIYNIFENIKAYFNTRLKINGDEVILAQWKSTNEQFLDLLIKTLKEITQENAGHNAKEDYEYVSDILIDEATEYAMGLFRMGQYFSVCDCLDRLLCNPVLIQNPKVPFLYN